MKLGLEVENTKPATNDALGIIDDMAQQLAEIIVGYLDEVELSKKDTNFHN